MDGPTRKGHAPIIIKPKRSKWQGLLRAVDAILLILQPIMQERPACFIDFPREVGAEELPQRFNFPFYYEPHPLCLEAAAHLQQYLRESLRGQENGKMFGVLLVQDEHGRLGYLRAFSGKLAGTNQWPGFVPPIFDLLNPEGFYRKGEAEINEINARIAAMEQSPELTAAMNALAQVQKEQEQELKSFKELIKTNKAKRAAQRAALMSTDEEHEAALEQLRQESIREQGALKAMQRHWKQKEAEATAQVARLQNEIEELKAERKNRSAALQEALFAQYNFLNKYGVPKNVKDIFAPTVWGTPPSGAGECAAPKLLQYAFEHRLRPLSFSEFWWGASPQSEIRKHGQYYPACRGKCEPILAHMLEGIDIDPNPMMEARDLGHQLRTIYEDEHIVVVDKPADMLSVPGKSPQTSVQDVLQARYPNATGPLLVHRLDMSTSGILIAAKTKEAHQYLQAQFIKKTAKKTYIAIVEGEIAAEHGKIELPLRVDFDNRPRQMVCFEHGKKAVTLWEKIAVKDGKTELRLSPVTGRTHQLRVHCAHPQGLGCPICGDDLYGNRAERLYLHAHILCIKHPVTKEEMRFEAPRPF